jgi:hypothetical protein
MRATGLVMIFGLFLFWGVQVGAVQEKEPASGGKSLRESTAHLKQPAHPIRWDFAALEGRFKINRLVVMERVVYLICQAKVDGVVKESDFPYSRFGTDKKRLATRCSVRLLQGNMRLEDATVRAETIKVKAGEEFRVALEWAPGDVAVRHVVVGSHENPRKSGPPLAAPIGFKRPERILDGSVYGRLYPALGDIDGDGKLDLLVGTWRGRLLVYRNSGTNARPMYGKPAWLDETAPTADITGVQG